MPIAIIALTLAGFAIGTSEFIIMGLMPEVASSLKVDLPRAGLLVTVYALGVVIGGPILSLATASISRKKTLIGLLMLFVIGNLCCACASGYSTLMVARVLTSLCHGTFFGLASIVATDLVKEEKRTQAIALVFMGVSLANILGVPVGTAIGQALGWRSAFVAVAIIGVLALFGLWRFLPRNLKQQPVSVRNEVQALRHPKVISGLALSVLCNASLFCLFTYVAPILGQVSGASPTQITYILFVLGLGLTIGTYCGGKLGDRQMLPWLTRLSLGLIMVLLLSYFALPHLNITVALLFLWSIIGFAFGPMLQMLVVKHAAKAPLLASAFNQSAFNLGNAIGAWISGTLLAFGTALRELPLAGAMLALIALLLALSLSWRQKHASEASR
ncbi:MFS transporter [Shewanella sp. A32]|uniref:MFS transporter n=1 Tax=Shewanella sp. A32 TaxID=3031327 RepID=UPI0023B9D2C8|nr:MFS transporter [Shewanella sp. A32]MDF0535389.1 MFS transporter [Shewanella sp. A32]